MKGAVMVHLMVLLLHDRLSRDMRKLSHLRVKPATSQVRGRSSEHYTAIKCVITIPQDGTQS